ncbi:hypothetical protein H4R35_002854 [Dimargaris xerosporica]|nr:hypothetical protein H4R35_002854 [Dimargaris xerosporica]
MKASSQATLKAFFAASMKYLVNPYPSKGQRRHREKSHRNRDREERRQHRHHSRDDSQSPERKSRKSKKKRRKEREGKSSSTRSKVSAINQQYGKYGVLYETDIYTKEEEFNLWLYEVKKLRPEEMSNPDSKRHFREFMEDYNTVTLPHEKYYNLRQWEDKHGYDHSQAAAKAPGLYGGMDLLRDEELASRQRRQANYNEAQKASHMPYMTKDHLLQLKQSESSRIAADKLRKMGYSSKDTTGFRF